MKRYPSEKFPKTVLRPEVVSKHEKLIEMLSGDVEKYCKIGRRDPSMFDWTLRVLENVAMSTVNQKYLDSLAVTKTKFALWEVLIDDLIDNADMRNFRLADQLLKIPFESDSIDRSALKEDELRYLEITKDIWDNSLMAEVKSYPHYEKYKSAFNFDLLQLLNALKYSRFVNEISNAVNIGENEAYVPHGMEIMIQMDLDLMCSDGFNDSELGALRHLNYISQKMAKIGNLIGTYPRELLESDMSSEAVVRFIKQHGNDFKFKLNKLLNRESRYPEFEATLIEEWHTQYVLAKDLASTLKSVDGNRYMKEREYIQEAYEAKADFW